MTAAVIAPLIAFKLVENTPLSFLYIRPDMFRPTAPGPVRPDIAMAAGGD
tara:strand:- start:15447 stop:15596 length:150 start_codon:yes stop_codon:yes gene_type:complete